MLVAVGEVPDDNVIARHLPFDPHEMAGRHVHGLDGRTRAMRHQFTPGAAAGGGDRRLDDAEIARAAGARLDDEAIARVLHPVAFAVTTLGDEARLRLWTIGGDDADLVGAAVGRRDDEMAAAAGLVDRHEEGRVGLSVDNGVIFSGSAERVPPDDQRPTALPLGIEHRAAVG